MALVARVGIQGSNTLKLLALTRYGRLGASSRMRMYQFLPALQALGVEVHVSPLLRENYVIRLYARKPVAWTEVAGDYLRRVGQLLRGRRFDLLWIEKELFPMMPAWFEQALKAFGVPYVVDYDDATFHNYDLPGTSRRRLLADKIDKVMSNATLVIGGNRYLAERARTAGARWVEVVPTVVDLQKYGNELISTDRENASRMIVGWIGAPVTVKYLEIVAPALAAFAAERPVQLRVIGASFSWPGLEVDCRPWTEDSEVLEIRDFDVGIMPLVDSPWERGKCGYKLIQCMACELPVVASPVGVNQEIVRDGKNGYLARTDDAWIAAFRQLSSDVHLRGRMGILGRRMVEEKYCLQVVAPHLAALFKDVVAGRKS